jgi:hypothetical protein
MNFTKNISKPPPILLMFIISIIFLSIQPFILKKHAIEFKLGLKMAQSFKKKSLRIKFFLTKKQYYNP